MIRRAATAMLIGLVKLYQITLSPVLGGQCRFNPTCSAYAIEALREHGPVRGSVMAAQRVLRCHPLSKGGYDPVPPASCCRPSDETAGAPVERDAAG